MPLIWAFQICRNVLSFLKNFFVNDIFDCTNHWFPMCALAKAVVISLCHMKYQVYYNWLSASTSTFQFQIYNWVIDQMKWWGLHLFLYNHAYHWGWRCFENALGCHEIPEIFFYILNHFGLINPFCIITNIFNRLASNLAFHLFQVFNNFWSFTAVIAKHTWWYVSLEQNYYLQQ